MPPNDPPTLSAIDTRGVGLRVQFTQTGRRWAHQVDIVIGPSDFTVLASEEGDDEQPIPPSPPLQQLTFQPGREAVPVALLVGMAGRNHWSMSVDACSERRRVRFDVACRVSGTTSLQLGSMYRSPLTWRSMPNAGGLCAEVDGYPCYLQSLGGDFAGPHAVIDSTDGRVRIKSPLSPTSITHRWHYEVRLGQRP